LLAIFGEETNRKLRRRRCVDERYNRLIKIKSLLTSKLKDLSATSMYQREKGSLVEIEGVKWLNRKQRMEPSKRKLGSMKMGMTGPQAFKRAYHKYQKSCE